MKDNDNEATRKRLSGFSLVELMIAVAILGILVAVGVPAFIDWLPDYRLKRAANDLYSTLQQARLEAVRFNSSCVVYFDTVAQTYQFLRDPGPNGTWDGGGDDTAPRPGPDGIYGNADDIPERPPVSLAGYGSNVAYGHAAANINATDAGGGAFPPDEVSFPNNFVEFNSRGMVNGLSGYVYFQNKSNYPAAERSSFAVSALTSGRIRLQKWFSSSGNWR
ncbi:MAG: GspH/FimT family pseudopilin [Thermodesulfobacteriota bacterium]|nr:GspH/FimT family pseudopilin [Thermodesulfobacteriota bacterium]